MERAYAGTVGEQLGGNSDGAVEIANWRDEQALPASSVAVVDIDDNVVAASMCSGTGRGLDRLCHHRSFMEGPRPGDGDRG